MRQLTSVLLCCLLLLALPSAAIAVVPEPQPVAPACADAPADRFADVSGTHADAIDCIGWWGVTQGVGDRRFNPAGDVTRDQMASFIAVTIRLSGGSLPASPPDAFTDDDGNRHQTAIDQLAALGVVGGVGGGNYAPSRSVTRGQMATFLAAAWEARTGVQLPAGTDFFDDDDGSAHEANINRVAAAGFTGGTASGRYAPDDTVTRAQMGTFLARFLAALVEQGTADYPPDSPVPMPAPPAACADVASPQDAALCLYAATAAGDLRAAMRVASAAAVNELHAASRHEAFETWEFTGCGEPLLLEPSSGVSCTFYEPAVDWVHGVMIELGMGTRDGAPFVEEVGYVG